MKKSVTFRNVLFPIWFLLVFPVTWLIVLPVNFIIDSLVILLAMSILKISTKKEIWKGAIFKVWIFGFLSDIAGCAFLFISQLVNGNSGFHEWFYENITGPAAANPFSNPFGFLFVALSIFIAAALIFLLNCWFSFKSSGLSKAEIKKISLLLAVLTAPYLYIIPSQWIW